MPNQHFHTKSGKMLKRGGKPIPRHRLAAARPFRRMASAIPSYYFALPSNLSMMGNDVDPDCESAEEGQNKKIGGILVSDAEVIAWAQGNGILNGADTDQVMQLMAQAGMTSGSGTYGDGPYSVIDFTDPASLQAAIFEALTLGTPGQIKLTIAADQLPSGAGNQCGWFLVGASPDQNYDHCMALCGYGTAQQFVDAIGQAYGIFVPVPSGVDPNTMGYAAYTWATIGFFDQTTVNNIIADASIRNPSTTEQTPGAAIPCPVTVVSSGPVPPGPGPGPTPPAPPPTPAPSPTLTQAQFQAMVDAVFVALSIVGLPRHQAAALTMAQNLCDSWIQSNPVPVVP